MAKSLYCPQCNEEYWGTQQSLADHPVCGGCGYDKLGKPDPTVFDLVTEPEYEISYGKLLIPIVKWSTWLQKIGLL
jgi:hypothetical protein